MMTRHSFFEIAFVAFLGIGVAVIAHLEHRWGYERAVRDMTDRYMRKCELDWSGAPAEERRSICEDEFSDHFGVRSEKELEQ